MLAKKVVAHTTCEQIRSRDVLGEKPCRMWSSRQPDSSNVVTLSVFWHNRHKNNFRTALAAARSSAIPAVWSQRLLDDGCKRRSRQHDEDMRERLQGEPP